MKNITTRKLLVWAGIYIVITGFLSTLFPLFTGGIDYLRDPVFQALSFFLPYVNFNLLRSEFMVSVTDTTSVGISLGSLAYYTVFLIALILFLIKGLKESKLLAFCISLLFLSSLVNLLFRLVLIITNKHYFDFSPGLAILSFIENIAWLALTFFLLKKIKSQEVLETDSFEEDGEIKTMFRHTPNWQRFAHLMIDRLLCLFSFFPLIFFAGKNFDGDWNPDDRFLIYIIFLPAIVIYLLAFESIFGFTPAKLLTGSRVTNNWGDKPSFQTILLRTLARLVPFEPFSFFTDGRWHDEWTETFVLKEKRTGFKAKTYLLLIPLIALIVYGWYAGLNAYGDHIHEKARLEKQQAETAVLKERFNHLTANDVIALDNKSEYGQTVLLKVKEKRKDAIVFARMNFTYENRMMQRDELLAYANSEDLQEVTIPVNELDSLLHYENNPYERRREMEILYDSKKYALKDIYSLAEPEIRGAGSGGYSSYEKDNGSIDLQLENYGAAFTIRSLRSLTDTAKWVYYPVYNTAATPFLPQRFSIGNNHYNYGDKYRLQLVVTDSAGKNSTWEIEGKHFTKTVKRVY